MLTFADLYADLRANNIRLYQYDVGNLRSATIEMKGDYAVFTDVSAFPTLREAKRAIAHEIGHCATGCTHKVSSPIDLVEKHEYKANRWAVTHYIPFQEIDKAVHEGYTQPFELAEYFDVPEHMIAWAIHYYIDICGMQFTKETDLMDGTR